MRRCSCHGYGAEYYSASRVGERAEEWSKEESRELAMDKICLIKKVIALNDNSVFVLRQLVKSTVLIFALRWFHHVSEGLCTAVMNGVLGREVGVTYGPLAWLSGIVHAKFPIRREGNRVPVLHLYELFSWCVVVRQSDNDNQVDCWGNEFWTFYC